jgi:hemerythrin-like domain-containing protein
MADRWHEIDSVLARMSAGERTELDEQEVRAFAQAYDRHIDDEENVLLPALRRLLSAADWTAIGHSMAQRRGVDWKDPNGP